jgi:hypothetical protein
MKIKFITNRKNHIQEGFGLLEATVAALLSFLFVGIGANLVLTANLYKIKAKRNDVMNSLIRADIESIKYQSSKQNDLSKCTINTLTGFASELQGNIGDSLPMPPITILGYKYILKRQANTITDPDILPISYSFAAQAPPGTLQSAILPEYKLTVQIIPNAAFQCNSRT